MRVLVAYDGSPGSAAVIEHLRRRRAGLSAVTEALVLAVADAPASPWPMSPELPMSRDTYERLEALTRDATAGDLKRLRGIVREAARRLRTALPGWSIATRVVIGDPATQILAHATAWKAELIVLGSRGRSWFQRWVLGSVARDVVNTAECDVRIVRGRLGVAGSPASIVIGIDGSPAAHAGVQAVARRLWPSNSIARVVVVVDAHLSARLGILDIPAAEFVDIKRPQPHRILRMAARALDLLRATGLRTQLVIKEGDPTRVLIHEATRCGADCLVVGARGLGRFERLMLGSVSTAAAMRAPCTVEVIRPAPLPTEWALPRASDLGRAREPSEALHDADASLTSAGARERRFMPTNRLKDFLDDEHVPYESIDHVPTYTSQRTAQATHTPGRLMAKTVVVKIDGKLAMIVVPASSRISLERLRQELRAERIELTNEAEFERLFPDSEPGAEPPFGNLYGVPVFVAENLLTDAEIAFNAGTHTEVVRMRYADFERLVKPKIVSVWVAPGPAVTRST